MTFWINPIGDEVDTRAPADHHIKPFPIAWQLAQINRFNGACIRPYSVAEHSLLVCEIVERELGGDTTAQYAALVHDAHEAFCGGDMPSPHKAEIGPVWIAWEMQHRTRVRAAMGIDWPFAYGGWGAIKQADLMALATEKRDLMPQTSRLWPVLLGIEPIGWLRLNSPERTAANWEDWRDRWIDKYHDLQFARGISPCTRSTTTTTTTEDNPMHPIDDDNHHD